MVGERETGVRGWMYKIGRTYSPSLTNAKRNKAFRQPCRSLIELNKIQMYHQKTASKVITRDKLGQT